MTVPTIGNVSPEIRRALENQNRNTTAPAPGATSAVGASLPTDTVQLSADVAYKPGLQNLGEVEQQVRAQNQAAAQSTVTDLDLDTLGLTPNAPTAQQVQTNSAASARAQTNRLPGNILQLLQE